MDMPGISLFQGSDSIRLNNSNQREEEEEFIAEEKKRKAEVECIEIFFIFVTLINSFSRGGNCFLTCLLKFFRTSCKIVK